MSAPAVVTVTPNPAIDHTVWVDGLRVGEVNRVLREHRNPAGKGVNVAAALGSWGVPTVATGLLGDAEAAPFEPFLDRVGVASRFVPVVGTTRTGLKLVDQSTGTTTDLNFPGFEIGPPELDALEAVVRDLSSAGCWVVIAGRLPPGAPPSLVRRLLDAARACGARVAADTSGAALRDVLDAGPDLVKPNRAELEEAFGRALPSDDALVSAAGELADRGIGTVVVSLGSDGALFVRGDEVVRARPPAVRVASTVGAGDAMVAGMLAADLEGRDLTGSARLATAFGAVAVATAGSLLDRGEIERLEERVTVERLR